MAERLSPMMEHYLKTKEEYKDCILFYRLGDFYEMFFDDALLVSKELELTLTGKDCGMAERAPMCGIPFHAADIYITKLVDNGHKVAICEQVQDPKLVAIDLNIFKTDSAFNWGALGVIAIITFLYIILW